MSAPASPWVRRADSLREDEGSVLPLVAGYLALGLLLIVVAVGATSLYVERKRLFSVADAAALAAAESFDLGAVERDGDALRPVLTEREVVAASAAMVATHGDRFEDLTIVEAAPVDGSTVRITLRAVWRPPLVAEILPLAVPLQVTAQARSIFLG